MAEEPLAGLKPAAPDRAESVSAERRRIGQELHDDVQQELTGLGLLAQNLSEALERQGKSAEAELAAKLARGIADTYRRIGSLARGLVTVEAPNLTAALTELATNTEDLYGIACRLECPGAVTVGDDRVALNLYRIAQEAVANAVKHARPRTITIRLVPLERELRLEVRDDGIGYAPSRRRAGGLGLHIMEHRCTLAGGRFEISRQESGGTLVTCQVPRGETA